MISLARRYVYYWKNSDRLAILRLSGTEKNDAGVRVGSGAYFYRAEATSSSGERRFSEMKKMVVVK